MLEIRNKTPFPVGLFPGLDREGYDDVTVVVKGTFDLSKAAQRTPPIAEAQVPLVHGDQFFGEPPTSSIKYESDTSPLKPGTDVVVVGHAYAGKRAAPTVDVGLVAGPLRKTVRVFGDRTWERFREGFGMTSPEPFLKMPLVYERAFGGSDVSDPDPARHTCERRNPVGVGFSGESRSLRPDGVRVPNLEDPRHLISSPRDAPPPAGFGFVGRSWLPRLSYVGTYDESWRRDRCPLLPGDFDDRFHNGAHPELVSPKHFKGGEHVSLSNASPDGELQFRVPDLALRVALRIKGKTDERPALLDTLLVEPDERRVVCSWRVTVRCPRSFLYVEHVTVTEGLS